MNIPIGCGLRVAAKGENASQHGQILLFTVTMSTAPPSAAAGASAEAQAAAFASDPRIHINKLSGTWQFEDDDGNEFEYDSAKAAWVPLVISSSTRDFDPITSRAPFIR